MKYIIANRMENSDVYKRANIDRKLFSKIISKSDYTPKKDTIIALSLALELDITQTNELLKSAVGLFSQSRELLQCCLRRR